jgi:hypothetical protein
MDLGRRVFNAAIALRKGAIGTFLITLDFVLPTATRTAVFPDASGPVALFNAVGNQSAGSLAMYLPIVIVTAAKTLALTDNGTWQQVTAAGTTDITIPLNATVAFPIGATIVLKRWNNGGSNRVVATAGVTLTGDAAGALNSPVVYGNQVILRKTATDTWNLEIYLPTSGVLSGTAALPWTLSVTPTANTANTNIATTAYVDGSHKPYVFATLTTAAVNLPNAAFTTDILFNSVSADTSSQYVTATGKFTATAATAGIYMVSASFVPSAACNSLAIGFFVNNVQIDQTSQNASGDNLTGINSGLIAIKLAANDALSIRFYQTNTTAAARTAVIATTIPTKLSLIRMGG